MGIGHRHQRAALYMHSHEKIMSFPSWKQHSVFQVPQDSSNSSHVQSNECQLSVMLFIAWGVKLIQYWFSRWRQNLGPEYLMILSHCIVQFFKVCFHFPFQLELLTDEVNPFLSFLYPFYLCLLELLYHQVMPLSLFVDAILGHPLKQVRTASES